MDWIMLYAIIAGQSIYSLAMIAVVLVVACYAVNLAIKILWHIFISPLGLVVLFGFAIIIVANLR